jgi:hypothetical protein
VDINIGESKPIYELTRVRKLQVWPVLFGGWSTNDIALEGQSLISIVCGRYEQRVAVVIGHEYVDPMAQKQKAEEEN